MAKDTVKTIYNGGYIPELGIEMDGENFYFGWLLFKHPDGQWVTLANLKSYLINQEDVEKEMLQLQLDEFKRLSESGESLGGELEEREKRMELEAENKKLRDDFDQYGNHHGTCAIQHGSFHCDCGYEKLKDKL